MKLSVLKVLGSALAVPTVALFSGHVWPFVIVAALLMVACAAVVMLYPSQPAPALGPSERRVAERRSIERRYSTSLASAVAVVALTAVMACSIAGCTAAQKQTALAVAQDINKYAPTAEAALDSAALALASIDPAISATVMVGVTGFDALSKAFNAALAAYLANPSASGLQDLQAAINAISANVNTATLNATRIVDPVSQAIALGILKAVLTVATYIFSLISQTESATQLEQVKSANPIQFARLRPYMDEGQLQQFAQDEGVPRVLAGFAVNEAFDEATARGL